MQLDLIGVYEVGGVRGRNVPLNPRYGISLPQAETLLIRLTIMRSSGVPVDVTGLAAVPPTLVVKKRPLDLPAAITVYGAINAAAGPGRIDFTVTPETTKDLPVGKYVYDIVAKFGDERVYVIPTSPFTLLASVGQYGLPPELT